MSRVPLTLSSVRRLTFSVRFAVSLITHPIALAPLLIGTLGLITIQCQIAAVEALGERASALTNSSISEMSMTMATSLNAKLEARGTRFALGLNRDIAEVQKVLDDDVFGGESTEKRACGKKVLLTLLTHFFPSEWVNTTTVVLNGTLVEFYDLVSSTGELRCAFNRCAVRN